MAVIKSYIRFNGNARQALEFYQSCLGGTLTVTTVGDSTMAEFMPDKKDQVFHATLHNGNLFLLGSDMVGDNELQSGNRMVLTLDCETEDEAKELFRKLSQGGKVGHELNEQPWGIIGDFQDQFGVDWFVVSMKPGQTM